MIRAAVLFLLLAASGSLEAGNRSDRKWWSARRATPGTYARYHQPTVTPSPLWTWIMEKTDRRRRKPPRS